MGLAPLTEELIKPGPLRECVWLKIRELVQKGLTIYTQVTIWRQCFPLIDSKGDYSGALVTDRDITEQVRVENVLRQSESTLRQILDLVPDMIFAKDYNGRFLLANQAVAESFGLRP